MNSSVFIIYHNACMLNLDAWLKTAFLNINQPLTCEEIQRFFSCTHVHPNILNPRLKSFIYHKSQQLPPTCKAKWSIFHSLPAWSNFLYINTYLLLPLQWRSDDELLYSAAAAAALRCLSGDDLRCLSSLSPRCCRSLLSPRRAGDKLSRNRLSHNITYLTACRWC